MKNIGILGSGAWGIGLLYLLLKNKKTTNITLFTRDLSKIRLHDVSIEITTSMAKTSMMDLLIIAIPSYAIMDNIEHIKAPNVLLTSKGYDSTHNLFPYEIVHDKFNYGIISGPNLAQEVMNDIPTSATIASNNNDIINNILHLFHQPIFILDSSNDVIGVQICGIIKNILSIGCGIADALKYGENTKAMILTKGINELKKIINYLNGDEETIFKYAGIGDFMLTCYSQKSRNYQFGKSMKFIDNDTTIEGYTSSKGIMRRLNSLKIPLITNICNIIHNQAPVNTLLKWS